MTDISFAGIVDNSTIDYPGKLSAVVYLCGCPYKCPWCHNPELISGETCRIDDTKNILEALKKNFLIQAVCVTGGEPLMQETTIGLLEDIKKETDLLLKIDTNCFFPERLEKALMRLDFLTTDIKAPLDDSYGRVVGMPGQWRQIIERLTESHRMLKAWDKGKEARTTIVPGLIDKKEDIEKIVEIVDDVGFTQYTLQQFRSEKTLDPTYMELKSPSREEMIGLGKIAKERLPDIKVVVVTQEGGFEEMQTA